MDVPRCTKCWAVPCARACVTEQVACIRAQGKAGFVGVDGKLYPPRWQIGEQAVGVAQKLL